MDLFKRIQDLSDLYDDDGPSATIQESRPMFNDGGMLVQPSNDGSRPGYSGVVKNVKPVEGTSHLFTAESGTGKKFYLSKFSSQNPEAGPGMKKWFPLTKEGKVDAIKAIESHIKEYPNIFKRPEYKGQTTIKKRADGVLTYAKRGAPTKTYDPKEYGSEAKAFKAAKKDVEASQVSKKTAAVKDINIEKVKELRAKGISIANIADEFNVQPRTISDRLIKAGESTKDLSIRVIPKEVQKDLIAKYPQIKNWDFKKHTLGFPYSENKQLYSRVQDFLSDPKPYEIAGDFSKADGWLAAQMNRSYKLGNKNFIPIKAMVNNKNKIVGFIDNTEFGGGGKYIVNEKFIKGKNADGVLMSLHPDYEDTAKFVDVSKKAKLPVQGVLKNLLKNEGIDTTRISLSDLFKYMKGEVGVEGTKSALEKHHISGVKNRATGNYQLLDRDLNALAKYVSQEIEVGDLSRVGELKKKGVMVEVDGQTYGSGPKTPEGQFKRFEKQVTNFFQNDPNAKNVIVRMAKIGCPGKANGGRIGFDQGLNVTSCAAKGVEKLQGDPGKLTPGDQANVRALAKSGKAVKFLKGVLGPGAILGEVIFEGGAAANKFMDQGMPIKQALGESYINKYLLGPKTQIDVEAERSKEFAKGEEYAMAERGRRMAPFMAQGAPRKDQLSVPEERRLKNRMQQMEEVYPTVAIPQIDLALQDAGLTQQETGMTYPELQDYIKKESQMQAIADAGGVANLAGGGIAKMAGDRSGAMTRSMNPDSQGLSYLFNRVKKV